MIKEKYIFMSSDEWICLVYPNIYLDGLRKTTFYKLPILFTEISKEKHFLI
jgi:hypothetical protein